MIRPRFRLRLLLGVLLALLALVPAGALGAKRSASPAKPRAGAAHKIFGLGDQNTNSMYANPLFRALHVQATRYVANWDVALHNGYRRQRLDRWYAAAVAARVRPLLSFGGYGLRRAPNVRQFGLAFKAALRRWPKVATWETWNEANHYTQPITFHHPERAAAYAKVMRHICPRCQLLPLGIVLQGGSAAEDGWIAAWARAYGGQPSVWGINDYSDTNKMREVSLASFLRRHPRGGVWLTEVAAFAKFSVQFPWDLKRQARAVPEVIRAALTFPTRVQRVYYYQWRGERYGSRKVGWDTGLVTNRGRPRPAYYALLTWRRKLP